MKRVGEDVVDARLLQEALAEQPFVGEGASRLNPHLTKVSEWSYDTYRELHFDKRERMSEHNPADDEPIDGEVIDDLHELNARLVFTNGDTVPPRVIDAFQGVRRAWPSATGPHALVARTLARIDP